MAATTKRPVTEDITEKLDDYGGIFIMEAIIVSCIQARYWQKEVEITLKSTVTAVLFPFAYVSLVFLCVAISLLAAHLMSTTKESKNVMNC